MNRMRETPSIVRIPSFDDVLSTEHLIPHFQPIVTMKGGPSVYGYEALARLQFSTPPVDTEFLFLYAERKERIADLDLFCIANSLAHGARLAESGYLFLNLHPHVLGHHDRLLRTLESAAAQSSVPLDRVVLEITEQGSISDTARLTETIEALRALGLRFALDDVGVAYSHLALIGRIRPSFLKISQHFGTGFETDSTKRKIIENIISLANDFECETILEGIETPATARAAYEIGIPLAQGYHYRRPSEAAQILSSPLNPEVLPAVDGWTEN
ncbi:MAG TPA: EAL domain-containing protein [Thermoanaerobaculia bacterium]|nr:EAL domain-containing protein [Thermoanaerobaculia bacterium]